MITTNPYVDVCKVSSNYKCCKVNSPHQTTLPSDINCNSGKVSGITLMFKKKEGGEKKNCPNNWLPLKSLLHLH